MTRHFHRNISQFDEDLDEKLQNYRVRKSGRSEEDAGRIEACGHTSESWLSGF
jgi:hypothetical protein